MSRARPRRSPISAIDRTAAAAVIASPDDRHERFAQSYVLTLSATGAYLEAYPGVSRKTAAANGFRLLRNADVATRIAELKRDRRAQTFLERDRVMRALLNIIESDPADLFDDDNRPLTLNRIPEETRRALASLKVRVNAVGDPTIVEYRLLDKTRAAELMVRILGMAGDTDTLVPPGVERQSIKLFGTELYF